MPLKRKHEKPLTESRGVGHLEEERAILECSLSSLKLLLISALEILSEQAWIKKNYMHKIESGNVLLIDVNSELV